MNIRKIKVSIVLTLLILTVIGCGETPINSDVTVPTLDNGNETEQIADKDVNEFPNIAKAEPESDFKYSYSSEWEGIIVEKYLGTKVLIQIPDSFEGIPVVGINNRLEESHTGIGSSAKIVMPETIKYIELVGYESSIAEINIPENLVSIKLRDCGIKELKLPASVTDIEISSCSTLVSLEVKGFKNFSVFDCPKLESLDFPNATVIDDGKFSVSGPSSLVRITIPDGVTEIELGSWESLTTVIIPDSVTNIRGDWVYYRNNNLDEATKQRILSIEPQYSDYFEYYENY